MEQFGSAILGGLMIGLSAALLFLVLGRIAGISGILWQSVSGLKNRGQTNTKLWPLAFIIGLLIGPLIIHSGLSVPIPDAPGGSAVLAVLGGLLVGIGTRMGSGCTSGHGICGIARLSSRSITATLTFMALGFVTVFVVRHLI